MKVTFWVMLAVGLIEVGSNVFFLLRMAMGKGLGAAKKFHGDFPAFASSRAWIIKITASIILGIAALSASFSIYQDYVIKQLLSSIFAGGILLLCVAQAILYGKKHLPARISIVLGLIFTALVFFQI